MGLRDFTVRTKADLVSAVNEFGILPLFKNSLAGFSVEEHAAREAWFEAEEGVWEWKGPVIRETGCAYGKLFCGKAAFVSRELYCELANFRRDGYDFDARYDDGLARYEDKALFDLAERYSPVISKRLKALGDYKKGGRKGFDTIIGRLQHECYVLISDFKYAEDKHGRPYGWGLAEYSTPERLFGAEFIKKAYRKKPKESYDIVFSHIKDLLPDAEDGDIARFLK